MRPIAVAQNPLRCPLNELLGTDANVRILRALAANEGPLSVKDLSEQTEITPAGTHQALKRLHKTGFVVTVGGSHGQRHTLRWHDPLLQSLIDLYTVEERRYEHWIDQIRQVFYRTDPPPISAWISGLPHKLGDTVEISVLGGAEVLTESMRSLRTGLLDVEGQFDVTIELKGYTRADLPPIEPLAYVFLAGTPLFHESGVKDPEGHREKDLERMRRSRIVAELIMRDPTLVSRARRYLERILATELGASRHDLKEWRDILQTYSFNRLRSFLSSASERAVRLSQSSPFWAVLTDDEKARMLSQPAGE